MKKIVRLTESDLVRIVKKVIKEQQAIGGAGIAFRVQQMKKDAENLEQACSTWNHLNSSDKQKARQWSKQFTKGSQFNMDTACSQSQAYKAIMSDNDRKVVDGIIHLNFM
jgi:hypothetical protein